MPYFNSNEDFNPLPAMWDVSSGNTLGYIKQGFSGVAGTTRKTMGGAFAGGLAGLGFGPTGGLVGAGIGASMGALAGTIETLTKQVKFLLDWFKRLTDVTRTLVDRFAPFNAALAQANAKWKLFEFQSNRTWARTLAPTLTKWNDVSLDFARSREQFKVTSFEIVRPLLENIISLISPMVKAITYMANLVAQGVLLLVNLTRIVSAFVQDTAGLMVGAPIWNAAGALGQGAGAAIMGNGGQGLQTATPGLQTAKKGPTTAPSTAPATSQPFKPIVPRNSIEQKISSINEAIQNTQPSNSLASRVADKLFDWYTATPRGMAKIMGYSNDWQPEQNPMRWAKDLSLTIPDISDRTKRPSDYGLVRPQGVVPGSRKYGSWRKAPEWEKVKAGGKQGYPTRVSAGGSVSSTQQFAGFWSSLAGVVGSVAYPKTKSVLEDIEAHGGLTGSKIPGSTDHESGFEGGSYITDANGNYVPVSGLPDEEPIRDDRPGAPATSSASQAPQTTTPARQAAPQAVPSRTPNAGAQGVRTNKNTGEQGINVHVHTGDELYDAFRELWRKTVAKIKAHEMDVMFRKFQLQQMETYI